MQDIARGTAGTADRWLGAAEAGTVRLACWTREKITGPTKSAFALLFTTEKITNCVEVDPVVWQSRMLERIGFDWSDQPSGKTLDDVSPVAVEVARRYLRDANGGDPGTGLANATDADLLRRLNLVKDSHELTNAGALLFVSTPWPGIDYIRRDVQ